MTEELEEKICKIVKTYMTENTQKFLDRELYRLKSGDYKASKVVLCLGRTSSSVFPMEDIPVDDLSDEMAAMSGALRKVDDAKKSVVCMRSIYFGRFYVVDLRNGVMERVDPEQARDIYSRHYESMHPVF